eukprot:COSAG03_NODE_338_length_8851_cov_33.536106_8_plen_53_part_00
MIAFAQRFGVLEGPHPFYSPDSNSPLAVVEAHKDSPPDGGEWSVYYRLIQSG